MDDVNSVATRESPSRLRRFVGLTLILVAGAASIATSPGSPASITGETSGESALDVSPSDRIYNIDVELSGPALSEDVGSLEIQVQATGTSAAGDRAFVRMALQGSELTAAGEALLVGDGSTLDMTAHGSLDHCSINEPCTVRFALLFERHDEAGEGSVQLQWDLRAVLKYKDRDSTEGPPEGAQLGVIATEVSPDEISITTVARLASERIVLTPGSPPARRTITVFIPQELLDGLVSAEGVLVAVLTPETAAHTENQRVLASFNLTDGDPNGRQLNPVGAAEAFDLLANCVAVEGGGCAIQKQIKFDGCLSCEFDVSLDWWISVQQEHAQPVPDDVEIEFNADTLLSDFLQEDTSLEGLDHASYQLTAVFDIRVAPDQAGLIVWIVGAGVSGSLDTSTITVRGPRPTRQTEVVSAGSPAEILITSLCEGSIGPCRLTFDITIEAMAGAEVVWTAEAIAYFGDRADADGARVEIELERQP